MRSVTEADAVALHRGAAAQPAPYSWCFPVRIPGPDEFADTLQRRCLAQFIATHEGAPVAAHLCCYDASARHATAWVAAHPVGTAPGDDVSLGELIVAFAVRVMGLVDLRDVYARLSPDTLSELPAADNVTVEACLKGHRYRDGRYHDELLVRVASRCRPTE